MFGEPGPARLRVVRRFILTVEGIGLNDVAEIELPHLPELGEPIETRLGTAIVTSAEPNDNDSEFAGRIVCRLD
jgi:hypothetical protein